MCVAIGKFYFDTKRVVNNNQVTINRSTNNRSEKLILDGKSPFTILLMGIDTGEYCRVDKGRSDSIMIATVNPSKRETSLLSIPRDTRLPIEGKQINDKVNHAYAFGGAQMSVNTLSKYLTIPIDYYVALDMSGLKKLVDVVDGVNIDNNLSFKQGRYEFPLGLIHLNGAQALEYVRMRYDDPRGDYGRQERQRKVVQALTNKLSSPTIIFKYKKIITILDDNLQTDFSFEDLQNIAIKYNDSLINQKTSQLKASEQVIDGISYQVPDDDELNQKREELQKQLALKK